MKKCMSKQEEITRRSAERGYYVDKKGEVYNSNYLKLSLSKSGKGYLSFNIRLNSGENSTRSFVHRLQAFQKFGEEIFKEGIVVRHLNGDSTDNSYDNIAIGTQSDNVLDVPKENRIKNSSNANKKYDHKAILKDREDGLSFSEIMAKHGISSKGTVSFIIKQSLEAHN
jgi:hypothetical protein